MPRTLVLAEWTAAAQLNPMRGRAASAGHRGRIYCPRPEPAGDRRCSGDWRLAAPRLLRSSPPRPHWCSVGLAAAFGYPLARGMIHLTRWLPGYVAGAEHGKGLIGHLAARYHLQAWLQHNEPRLADFGQALAGPTLSLGKDAMGLAVALTTIPILVLLLLLEGPKMRIAALALMPLGRAVSLQSTGGRGKPVGLRICTGQPAHVRDRRTSGIRHLADSRHPVRLTVRISNQTRAWFKRPVAAWAAGLVGGVLVFRRRV